VGHDWGGVVAWTFASERPELVDRLVIVNAPHPRIYRRKAWRPPQLLRSWYALFFQLPWLPERVLAARDFHVIRTMLRRMPARPGTFSVADIDRFVEALRRPGALTAALDYYRANLSSLVRGAAARPIEAETLVIWGERDPALSVGLLDGIDRVAPRARVARFPEAGHWVHSEIPDEVNRQLVGFLSGDRAAGAGMR
ncbi:MAG TPA: alpha/beta fold hydrolase, partial [Planctomycetaceae bacterium]